MSPDENVVDVKELDPPQIPQNLDQSQLFTELSLGPATDFGGFVLFGKRSHGSGHGSTYSVRHLI